MVTRLEEKSSSVLKKHLDADGSLDSGLLTLIMSFLVSHWGTKKNYPKNKLKKIKKRRKYPRGSAFIHRIPVAGAHTSQDSLSHSQQDCLDFCAQLTRAPTIHHWVHFIT